MNVCDITCLFYYLLLQHYIVINLCIKWFQAMKQCGHRLLYALENHVWSPTGNGGTRLERQKNFILYTGIPDVLILAGQYQF